MVIDSFRKITYSAKGLRVLHYEDPVVRRWRGEWFDTCTAREEFFAPDIDKEERSIEQDDSRGNLREEEGEEDAIVLHGEREKHSQSAPSPVSNPPPRRRQVRRDGGGDSGLVDSIDRMSRVIETILNKMDRINNRLDLLEAHVDAANAVRFGHAGREVQIFRNGQANGSGDGSRGDSGANSISDGSSMQME